MVDSALIFGRAWGAYTKRIIRAVNDYFDSPDLVVYLFDMPDNESEDYYRDISAHEVIWDYEIEQNRSLPIDIEYLESIERKYRCSNLWQCLMADRKLVREGIAGLYYRNQSSHSHDDLLSHLEARVRKLDQVFDNYDFDFVYGGQIMRLGGMLAFKFADITSTPFFRVGTTRIKNRMTVLESIHERSPQLMAAFRSAKRDPKAFPIRKARQYIEHIQEESLYSINLPDVQEYDENGHDTKTFKNISNTARKAYRIFLNPLKYTSKEYYYQTPVIERYFYLTQKIIRKWYQSSNIHFDEFDPSVNYVYFPLQVQPELSLMIWARYFNDFPSVIENVAQSLPIGTELFVNEHPEMIGVRSTNFYDQLRRLPHVRVINSDLDTNSLINSADAVVTITSSVGLQALIQEVPVVTIGKPMYSEIESVHTISGYSDLSKTIDDAINSEVDMEEVTAYVASCLAMGIPRDDIDFPTNVCEYINRSINYPDEKGWKYAMGM